MAEIKWSQWDNSHGMIRCGHRDMKTLMKWMKEMGADARKCLANQDKAHAIYGRKMYDEYDNVSEIRFYCNVYVDDKELEELANDCGSDLLYVAHK